MHSPVVVAQCLNVIHILGGGLGHVQEVLSDGADFLAQQSLSEGGAPGFKALRPLVRDIQLGELSHSAKLFELVSANPEKREGEKNSGKVSTR